MSAEREGETQTPERTIAIEQRGKAVYLMHDIVNGAALASEAASEIVECFGSDA